MAARWQKSGTERGTPHQDPPTERSSTVKIIVILVAVIVTLVIVSIGGYFLWTKPEFKAWLGFPTSPSNIPKSAGASAAASASGEKSRAQSGSRKLSKQGTAKSVHQSLHKGSLLHDFKAMLMKRDAAARDAFFSRLKTTNPRHIVLGVVATILAITAIVLVIVFLVKVKQRADNLLLVPLDPFQKAIKGDNNSNSVQPSDTFGRFVAPAVFVFVVVASVVGMVFLGDKAEWLHKQVVLSGADKASVDQQNVFMQLMDRLNELRELDLQVIDPDWPKDDKHLFEVFSRAVLVDTGTPMASFPLVWEGGTPLAAGPPIPPANTLPAKVKTGPMKDGTCIYKDLVLRMNIALANSSSSPHHIVLWRLNHNNRRGYVIKFEEELFGLVKPPVVHKKKKTGSSDSESESSSESSSDDSDKDSDEENEKKDKFDSETIALPPHGDPGTLSLNSAGTWVRFDLKNAKPGTLEMAALNGLNFYLAQFIVDYEAVGKKVADEVDENTKKEMAKAMKEQLKKSGLLRQKIVKNRNKE
jgi:hypothetical protein